MKILISGFEPFGEELINPSWEAVKLLPDTIGDIQIIKTEIPVVRYKAVEMLTNIVVEEKVDAVISVGQSGGSDAICIERLGINIDDYRIPDNDGNQPIDEMIIEDAQIAYFSTLPVKRIVHQIEKQGIKVRISNSAGTYVCNHVLFCMSHFANTQYPNMKVGFVHIPFIDEQVVGKQDVASMKLDSIVKALTITIQCLSKEDV